MSRSSASGVRLVAEILAIILSILAAFAIDAWWGGRQALVEEAEILSGLNQEFVENAALLSESMVRSEQGMRDLRRFLTLSPDEVSAITPEQSWAQVYEPLIRAWTTSLSTGFLDATISSGKLALLHDPRLRAALARFQGLQADVDEVMGYINGFNTDIASILGEFEAIQAAHSRGEEHLSPETIASLRGSARLRGAATAKLIYWDPYLFELGRLQAQLGVTSDLIRENRRH
ncbi:MAG: hypothetical protein ACC682_15675 [Gemmatimonadota bacterium]